MKICRLVLVTKIHCQVFSDKPSISLYNCGLLGWKKRGYVSVSSDGVAEIKLQSSDTIIYFVKIKTRVVERTIKITLKEYKSLGGNAFCSYEYAMFCKYIPFESRV